MRVRVRVRALRVEFEFVVTSLFFLKSVLVTPGLRYIE